MKGKNLTPPEVRPSHVVFCADCATAIEPNEPISWQRGWWSHPKCTDNRSLAVDFEPCTVTMAEEKTVISNGKDALIAERRKHLHNALAELERCVAIVKERLAELDEL